MSLPTYIVSGVSGASGVIDKLPAAAIKHMRVARLKEGERFIVSDGHGNGAVYELLSNIPADASTVAMRLIERCAKPRTIDVTLVQGISVADRMDQTLRQTTELGVARVVPLICERSTVKLSKASGSAKAERWRRIVHAAAEQSGQFFVPVVEEPCALTRALQLVAGCDVLICPWEEAGRAASPTRATQLAKTVPTVQTIPSSQAVLTVQKVQKVPTVRSCLAGAPSRARIALFIGPEGGFSAAEVDAMHAAGAQVVSLGATILRTETAAVVATALIMHELGGLGNTDANAS
jgi:16S rRNA (uracil1498-N3)-methyltransferase